MRCKSLSLIPKSAIALLYDLDFIDKRIAELQLYLNDLYADGYSIELIQDQAVRDTMFQKHGEVCDSVRGLLKFWLGREKAVSGYSIKTDF